MRLQELLSTDQRPLPESLVDDLKAALQAAKSTGIADHDAVVQQAMEVREATVRESPAPVTFRPGATHGPFAAVIAWSSRP